MSTALQKAREKRDEMRAAGIEVERLDPIEKAKRNPQSKALAIKAKCWECVGCGIDPNPRAAIRDCQVIKCPLHNVRPFQAKDNEDD